MINFLKNLFYIKPKPNFEQLIHIGAILLDVRTKQEYARGHNTKSINIPLDELGNELEKLQKEVPVITVCQSGIRSRMAVSILKKNGFTEVYNGGVWSNFNN